MDPKQSATPSEGRSGKRPKLDSNASVQPPALVRERYTNYDDKPERRLQSLVEVLEAGCQCTAIALLERSDGHDELLIAANSLTENTTDRNQQAQLLERTVGYFQTRAAPGDQPTASAMSSATKSLDDQRKALLVDLCLGQASTELKMMSVVGGKSEKRKIVAQVVDDVIARSSEHMTPKAMRRTYGPNAWYAGAVHGIFSILYSDFKKVEQSLDGDLKHVIAATPRFIYKDLRASKSASKKAVAHDLDASTKDQKTVLHAEMQLLNSILEKLSLPLAKPIQIDLAISKLCCLNCRAVLDAVNRMSKEAGISFQVNYPGAHNSEHAWQCPSVLKAGYTRSTLPQGATEKEKFLYRVGTLAAENAQELSAQAKQSGQNIDGDISHSDAESTAQEQLFQWRVELQSLTALVEPILDRGMTLHQVREGLNVLAALCETRGFNQLLANADFSGRVAEEDFIASVQEAQSKMGGGVDIQPNHCLALLKDAPYVPSVIQSLFQAFTLSSQVFDTNQSDDPMTSASEKDFSKDGAMQIPTSTHDHSHTASSSRSQVAPPSRLFGGSELMTDLERHKSIDPRNKPSE